MEQTIQTTTQSADAGSAIAYTNREVYATFWDHVEQLRQVFVRIIFTIVLGLILACANYTTIIDLLKKPFENTHSFFISPSFIHQRMTHERVSNVSTEFLDYTLKVDESIAHMHRAEQITPSIIRMAPDGYIDVEIIQSSGELMLFGPIEGMMIMLKVCFWTSIAFTAPIWIFFLFRFISPALPHAIGRLLLIFTLLSLLFMGMGFLLAFHITIPIANRYLMLFNDSMGTNFWSLSYYLDYTVFLLLGSGLSFELFLILLLLVHTGRVTSTMMINKRRHFCILALIVAAILTPPDVVTQLLLASPLIMLYEMAILYARYRNYRSSVLIKQDEYSR